MHSNTVVGIVVALIAALVVVGVVLWGARRRGDALHAGHARPETRT